MQGGLLAHDPQPGQGSAAAGRQVDEQCSFGLGLGRSGERHARSAARLRLSPLGPPGWTFVTGKKENVDWVLHKLGLYEDSKDEHTAILWVGNERTGLWMKMHAMSPPSAIMNAIRKAQNDRGA